eukprot:Gb_11161 [translate_table: standard]
MAHLELAILWRGSPEQSRRLTYLNFENRKPATRQFDYSFAPIPKSDERFARQYRCGPSPEFPLASPCSGIVHHLSSPNRYARTRTLHRRSGSVDCAPPREGDLAIQLPYASRPVDQRHERVGAREPIARAHASFPSPHDCETMGGLLPALVPPHWLALVSALSRATNWLSPFRILPGHTTGLHPLPSRVAFPNNSTCRQHLVVQQDLGQMGLSPSWAPPSMGLGPGLPLRMLLQSTIREARPPNFHVGLFPRVFSPDLGSRAASGWSSCVCDGLTLELEVVRKDARQMLPASIDRPCIARPRHHSRGEMTTTWFLVNRATRGMDDQLHAPPLEGWGVIGYATPR